MSKKNKGLPFPVKMALKAAVARNTSSEEEKEKVMQALEHLDLQTLLRDPNALANVMNNPAALADYVVSDSPDDAEDVESAECDENESGAAVPDEDVAEGTC